MNKPTDDTDVAGNADSTRNSELNGALGAGQLQAGGALRIAVFAIEDAFRSLDNHWRTKLDRQAYLGKRTELDTVRMAVLDSIKPVWDLVDKP